MELLTSDEQDALVETTRRWLEQRTDLAAAHADRAQVRVQRAEDFRAAAELGLVGLLRVAEGGTQVDLALVVEELGRAGSPLPIGQAAVACRALDDAGLAADVADRAGSGDLLVVPVLPEPGEPPVRAYTGPDGALKLDGSVQVVVGARHADRLLVAAAGADGASLLALVEAGAPRLGRMPRMALDITREFAAVTFDGVHVAAAAWTAVDDVAMDRLRDALVLHHAADALGAADRLLAMTLAYVRERSQFGRPVGGFQAVKHHCADMAMDVECARVTVRAAARALDADGTTLADVDRRAALATAAAIAGEACSRVAGTALQLHGGMGFTWEHDLHLFLRRIKTGELLGGTPRHHLSRLLEPVA